MSSPSATNTRTCFSSSGAQVGVSGLSTTTGFSNTNLEAGYVTSSSNGFGVRNSDWDSPSGDVDSNENGSTELAVDNDERYDTLLFLFTTSIRLTNVDIGWHGDDSDITVLAYTGAGFPPLQGLGYSFLLGRGWTVVGHYNDAHSNSAVNSAGLASRYWLVGAFNPLGDDPGYSRGNDQVLIRSVVGEASVPEPASLALLGFGLVLTARRLRSARA